jgi:hypothetical protein
MEFFDDTTNKKNNTKVDIDTQVELVTCFFNHFREGEVEEDFFKSMLVDLYRAITCYRMYNSLDEFMRINPELEDCRSDIRELWAEFDKLSSQELAEVALELLKDI